MTGNIFSSRKEKLTPDEAMAERDRTHELDMLKFNAHTAASVMLRPQINHTTKIPGRFLSPNHVPDPAPESVIDLHTEEPVVDGYIDEMHQDLVGTAVDAEAARRNVEAAYEGHQN